jgi:hypothetical protein
MSQRGVKMGADDRSRELQGHHNQGEQDASKGKYMPPASGGGIPIISDIGNILLETDRDRENDAAYKAGHTHTTEQSNPSCCYITSACLDAMHLPRDSLEMKAMKLLTREHILKTFAGKRDYVAYGRKAPAIVSAIRSREDSQRIWERVYETLRNITATITSGDYQQGHAQYKDLVLRLESEFAR